MSHTLLILLLVALGGTMVGYLAASAAEDSSSDEAAVPVVHNVCFSLKDRSKESVDKLVADCKKYLSTRPGVTYFACGVVSEGLERPVNDRDWDVGLHVVFKDRPAHDKYQEDPEHLKFIAENKDTWARVRVFDTDQK